MTERRSWLFLGICASLLLGATASGCDENKKAKECISKCEKAVEACVERKETACEDRGKKCGSYCEEHAGEFRF